MWSSAYEWASEAMSFSDASAAPKTPSAPKAGPSTSMAEEALPILRRACERELPDAELLRFLHAKEWDIKRAAAAVRTTVAWRRERAEALRQLRIGPACLAPCLALMGNDGCAWPVYCLRPGQLQTAAIGRDVTTEVISTQAVAGYEALRRLLRVHQADATGLTLLLDMRDVPGRRSNTGPAHTQACRPCWPVWPRLRPGAPCVRRQVTTALLWA